MKLNNFYKLFFSGFNKFDLAIYRIIFFTLIFIFFGYNRYFLGFSILPNEFWEPNGFLRFFESVPIGRELFLIIFNIWQVSLFFCIFGLFYSLSGPICFILGFYIANQAHSYGYQTHTFLPVFLATLPMCFANASDVISLDYFIFKKYYKNIKRDESDYSWPIRSIQFVFCLVFFSAGVSKLLHGGFEWITSDTLRNYFMRSFLVYFDVNNFASSLRVNEWFYEHSFLCNVLAAFTVIIECSSLFAFINKKYAKFFVPIIFLFQIGILFTMYVNFLYYIAIYLSWIPWSRLLSSKTKATV